MPTDLLLNQNSLTYQETVLQGDVFSPVAFIVGLWLIFKRHDRPNSGITVGEAPYQVHISNLEYADDAGLVDASTIDASERLSGISDGSTEDASMAISFEKTKAMSIHEKVPVTETKEEEVIALNLKQKCPKCDRSFPTQRGMQVHRGRFRDKRRPSITERYPNRQGSSAGQEKGRTE